MSEMDCRAWWDKRFPGSPPVGFMLRQTYRDRWLRIHSLPKSERYARTEGEYAELLRRHNVAATEALGEGSPCFLIQGTFVWERESLDGWIAKLTDDEDEQYLRVAVAEVIWSSGGHDELLREVADCKTANVVFASRESGRIYAPYDGGADLIYLDGRERDERKQAYRSWLSIYPEGL